MKTLKAKKSFSSPRIGSVDLGQVFVCPDSLADGLVKNGHAIVVDEAVIKQSAMTGENTNQQLAEMQAQYQESLADKDTEIENLKSAADEQLEQQRATFEKQLADKDVEIEQLKKAVKAK